MAASIETSIEREENQEYSFKLLVKCSSSVLTDKGFDIPSEEAQKARLCAAKLLEWMKTNKPLASTFAINLVKFLQSCCSHPRPVKFHTIKERMWERYYKYCSSEDFRRGWGAFIEQAGFQPHPILYQFITDEMLTYIIKDSFPVINDMSVAAQSLDYEEANALRYTAGYILRAVSVKVTRSARSHKVELLNCIKEILEGMLHTNLECC